MIRVKISNFIRKHKNKIYDLGKKLLIVAMTVFIATIILSSLSVFKNTTNEEEQSNVYTPTDTIIQGSDISKEQYEQDSNLVNKFLEYCNNKKIEEAYSLISEECKEEQYSTIDEFKQYYYNYIFDKKRECNLQAWISNSDYTVYRVRYTNNMLATGTYDENDVYQDYLTLNKKNNEEKISIGSFIDSENLNVITKTDEIEARVIKKKVYISEEEYDIYIKNNTDKTILLDNLESSETIWLMADGKQYRAYTNKLFMTDLIIEPGETNRLKIRFIKNLGSNTSSDKIEFLNVIRDYDTYIKDKDTTNITIKVED